MKTAGIVWLLVGYLKFNDGRLAEKAGNGMAEGPSIAPAYDQPKPSGPGPLVPGFQHAGSATVEQRQP